MTDPNFFLSTSCCKNQIQPLLGSLTVLLHILETLCDVTVQLELVARWWSPWSQQWI